MRRAFALVSVLLAASLFTTPAHGASFGGGSSSSSAGAGARGGSVSSSSSSSRPATSSPSSSSSRPASSSPSRPSAGYGGARVSTPRQPSSGRIQQPAPASRLAPRSLPPNVRVPRGGNFARDTARLRSNPHYMDPYDPLYFGNPASPLFYLYLAALSDNDRGNNPVTYQARPRREKKGDGLGVGWVILIAGVCLVGGGIAGAMIAGSDY
jgi:hypothetical protein